LASVLDVLDDDALVMPAGITVLLLKALADAEHLLIRQPFILHRIDADMVQRFLGARRLAQHPHVAEGLIDGLGVGIANRDKPHPLVLALLLQVVGSSPVAAPDMAFDNHVGGPPRANASRTCCKVSL